MEGAVDSLEKEMRKNCGYMVDRRNICYILRDVILIFLITISLLAFGKLPAIVLAMYPVGVFFELVIGDIYVDSALDSVTPEMKYILLGLGGLGKLHHLHIVIP